MRLAAPPRSAIIILAGVLGTFAAGCSGASIGLSGRGLSDVGGGASVTDSGASGDEDHSGDAGGASSTEVGTGDDHGDEPSWVNGSFLTCAWSGTASDDEVELLCQLDDRDGEPAPPTAGIVVEWQVQRSSGDVAAVQQAPTGSLTAIERRFIVPATIVADLIVNAILRGPANEAASEPLAVLSLPLEVELPGLAPGDEVRDCFERGDPADECLGLVAPTPTPTPKRFFVTSQAYAGNLGGIAGADDKCATAATSAGLGGTWMAVLSTTTALIADRVPRGSPVVDLNGATLASDAQILLGGGPDSPLGVDENGTAVAAADVWTGSLTGGDASGQDCNEWTVSDVSGTTGAFGGGAAFGEWLVSNIGTACSATARLYCLEL